MDLPDYSPDTLRALLSRHKLSGSAAGRLLRVDSRTIRKWTAAAELASHRTMPESSWLLLLILTGEATVNQVIQEAEAHERI